MTNAQHLKPHREINMKHSKWCENIHQLLWSIHRGWQTGKQCCIYGGFVCVNANQILKKGAPLAAA